MKYTTKYLFLYFGALVLLCLLVVNLAKAETIQQEPINQARLEQVLAPIALYPDTLLSQVLTASTYPLELVQAHRWREDNQDLSAEQALSQVEDKPWAPSVKALVPFDDLLKQLNDDLVWLQEVGDAFLQNEEQVLETVQLLRKQAREVGNLDNNGYVEVIEEKQGDIIIQPVEKEVIYVPYYDTRYVYGTWRHHAYPPHYWHQPAHYYAHSRYAYFGPRIHIGLNGFWGGFHWHNRYTVVYTQPYYSTYHNRHVRNREYKKWQHQTRHRRNVGYSSHRVHNKHVRSHSYQPNKKVVRSSERSRQNVALQRHSKTPSTSHRVKEKLQRKRSENTYSKPVRTPKQTASTRDYKRQKLNSKQSNRSSIQKAKTHYKQPVKRQTYKKERPQKARNYQKQKSTRTYVKQNTHHKKSHHRESTSSNRAKLRKH